MSPAPPEKRAGSFAGPGAYSADPGLDRAAREILGTSELIDLHVESFLPVRLFGYDLRREHRRWNPGFCVGHLDAPGIRAGGLGGAMWSITANVFLPPGPRWRAFSDNVRELEAEFARCDFLIARNYKEYKNKRKTGRHVGMIAVQGGNVCQAAPAGALSLPDAVVRVTLVHMTNSVFGAASTPLAMLRPERGLSRAGRALVAHLNARRVFVDLAHIHPDGFRDALAVHARDLPVLVTHTGVNGVKPHWRNLDDHQIRSVANTGGVIGVIFSDFYLRPRGRPPGGEIVLEHLDHLIRVGGEDLAAIGSDFDGMIIPPFDLRDARAYGRLTAGMLRRGWSVKRIKKILGENFLRAFRALRPG